MKYFAYGSNLSLARLRERVPGAERMGVFHLGGHQLRFHKIGEDGSGKCDAFETEKPDHRVIGSLYEIDEAEKPVLDKAESLGYGYEEKAVIVSSAAGETFEAVTYYAIRIDSSLRPYSWYLNHVIIGAQETQVPDWYLEEIQLIESTEDADSARDAKERAIHRR